MNKVCKNPTCLKPIKVTAFLGEDYCCIDCKKALGLDVSSVGTIMFVTKEEEETIRAGRAGGSNG